MSAGIDIDALDRKGVPTVVERTDDTAGDHQFGRSTMPGRAELITHSP